MLLTLAALLTVSLLSLPIRSAPADDAPAWQRLDKKGIKSGRVEFGYGNLFAVTCPASLPTAQPRLLIRVQALDTAYETKSRYNLRVVINDYRADFGMVPQMDTLLFEASDFNQREMFEEFVRQLISAAQGGTDHAQLAISSLGWRGDLPLAAADQVLNGLMDGCGQ